MHLHRPCLLITLCMVWFDTWDLDVRSKRLRGEVQSFDSSHLNELQCLLVRRSCSSVQTCLLSQAGTSTYVDMTPTWSLPLEKNGSESASAFLNCCRELWRKCKISRVGSSEDLKKSRRLDRCLPELSMNRRWGQYRSVADTMLRAGLPFPYAQTLWFKACHGSGIWRAILQPHRCKTRCSACWGGWCKDRAKTPRLPTRSLPRSHSNKGYMTVGMDEEGLKLMRWTNRRRLRGSPRDEAWWGWWWCCLVSTKRCLSQCVCNKQYISFRGMSDLAPKWLHPRTFLFLSKALQWWEVLGNSLGDIVAVFGAHLNYNTASPLAQGGCNDRERKGRETFPPIFIRHEL